MRKFTLLLSACLAGITAQADSDWVWESKPVTWTVGETAKASQTIRFELPSPGRVSLGIYDADDRMLRVLLHGERMESGPHQAFWDGLDSQGKPAAPGEYSWKLVHSPGLTSRFLFRLGSTVPDEPWQRWVGDHVPVSSMAADETGFYFVSSFTEVPDMILKFDPDLKKRTASSRQWYDGNELSAVGIADQALFGLTRAGQIRRLNRDTLTVEATWPYIPTPPGHFVSPNDLAAAGGVLVATDVAAEQVHFLDPASGARVKSVAVPQPRKLTVDSTGNVYVTCGDGAVRTLNAEGEVAVKISGLSDPSHITVAPATGGLVIHDAGQLKCFNQQGKLLATHGREGGRLQGAYEPRDFSGVADLLADGKGHVLVAEMWPVDRVARVDIRSGNVVSEWFGGHSYYNFATITPSDPTDVWFESGNNVLLRMKADYDANSWSMLEAYVPVPGVPGGGAAGHPYLSWFPRVHNGETYLLCSNHWIYRIDREKRVMRAIRTVAHVNGQLEVWSDLNEDQQRTEDEVKRYPGITAPQGISWVDRDWNLWIQNAGTAAYAMIPFAGWDENNPAIPTWDHTNSRVGPELPEVLRQNPDYGGLYVDSNGTVHQTKGAMRMPGDERHGDFWPALELSVARYLQWTGGENSSLKTITGRHQVSMSQGMQNVFTQPGGIIGEAKGVLSASDRAGQPTGVSFDRDSGLYVGNLLENRAADGLPDWVYNPWGRVDFSNGKLFELPDGRAIWIFQDWNDHTVMEVTGLDEIRRVQGTVTLKNQAVAAKREGSGLRGIYYRNWRFKDEAFRQVDPRFRFGPKNTNDYGENSGPWLQKLRDADIPVERFSVVWEGFVEAPVTENYQFSLYLTGSATLFLNGKEILSTRELGHPLQRDFNSNVSGTSTAAVSPPVRLEAGKRVPIRIEWRAVGTIQEQYLGYNGPMFHLNWESPIHDRLSIPTGYLYPKEDE